MRKLSLHSTKLAMHKYCRNLYLHLSSRIYWIRRHKLRWYGALAYFNVLSLFIFYVIVYLTDINECTLGYCDVNSDCVNTPGNYTCSNCHLGYNGTGYTRCDGKFNLYYINACLLLFARYRWVLTTRIGMRPFNELHESSWHFQLHSLSNGLFWDWNWRMQKYLSTFSCYTPILNCVYHQECWTARDSNATHLLLASMACVEIVPLVILAQDRLDAKVYIFYHLH